jgi:hypothetical protein
LDRRSARRGTAQRASLRRSCFTTGSVGGGRSADGHALDSIVVEDRGVRLAQEVEEHEDAPQHKCERERSSAAPFPHARRASLRPAHAHTRARGTAPVRAWPRACSVRSLEQMQVASLCAFEADGSGARACVCACASVCGRMLVCARVVFVRKRTRRSRSDAIHSGTFADARRCRRDRVELLHARQSRAPFVLIDVRRRKRACAHAPASMRTYGSTYRKSHVRRDLHMGPKRTRTRTAVWRTKRQETHHARMAQSKMPSPLGCIHPPPRHAMRTARRSRTQPLLHTRAPGTKGDALELMHAARRVRV